MFKRLISFVLVCVMTVSCCFTCFAETTQVSENEIAVPQKIVFLGDSIAAGYGLEGYTNGADSCGLLCIYSRKVQKGAERYLRSLSR